MGRFYECIGITNPVCENHGHGSCDDVQELNDLNNGIGMGKCICFTEHLLGGLL